MMKRLCPAILARVTTSPDAPALLNPAVIFPPHHQAHVHDEPIQLLLFTAAASLVPVRAVCNVSVSSRTADHARLVRLDAILYWLRLGDILMAGRELKNGKLRWGSRLAICREPVGRE